MKQLKPVVMVKGLENEIYQTIEEFFNDFLFNYIDEVLNDNVVFNSKGLVTALLKGHIKYEKGLFFSNKKIPNTLAKELEKLGGKWSKTAKGYRISGKKLPVDVMQAIAQVNIHNREKIDKIQQYLDSAQENAQYIIDKISFDTPVQGIVKNLDMQLKKSLSEIQVIPPAMTESQVKEISKNYTNNLNYYIQKWTGSEIIKLREKLQPYVMEGYRASSLEGMIAKEKGISKKKAKFLARQETKLLVSEYRKNRFQQMGVTRYIWRTVLDGRERPLHKEHNGKIFSWSNPPIIDDRTGERGNPGEAYNCRCIAIPVLDDLTK